MNKHYVTFDTPGVFMPESETRIVSTRIPARLRKIPKWTYALAYFDRKEVRGNGELLRGEAKNRSRRVIFGEAFTQEQLPALGFDEHTSLYRNAESDGKVIKCIAGNWQPWDKDWIILANYDALRGLKNPI